MDIDMDAIELFRKIRNAFASTAGRSISDAELALIIYIYESEKKIGEQ